MASSHLPAGDQASTQYSRLLKLRWLLMAVFVAVILLSLVADFMLGPSGLSWSELMRTLFSPDQAEPTTSVIVWDVRLPYAVMAVVVGLGLGLAGAEMQTILANPLASPFTLGISSAAAFGASLALVLDLSLPCRPSGPWPATPSCSPSSRPCCWTCWHAGAA